MSPRGLWPRGALDTKVLLFDIVNDCNRAGGARHLLRKDFCKSAKGRRSSGVTDRPCPQGLMPQAGPLPPSSISIRRSASAAACARRVASPVCWRTCATVRARRRRGGSASRAHLDVRIAEPRTAQPPSCLRRDRRAGRGGGLGMTYDPNLAELEVAKRNEAPGPLRSQKHRPFRPRAGYPRSALKRSTQVRWRLQRGGGRFSAQAPARYDLTHRQRLPFKIRPQKNSAAG